MTIRKDIYLAATEAIAVGFAMLLGLPTCKRRARI